MNYIKYFSLHVIISLCIYTTNSSIHSAYHYKTIQTNQILYKLDELYTKTEIQHPDKTITLNYFNDKNANITRIQLDAYGNITSSIQFYPDGSLSKTIYASDRSTTEQKFNPAGRCISVAATNQYGQIITVSKLLLTAWHEAGHTVAYIYLHPTHTIQQVSIQPTASQQSDGHVQYVMPSSHQTIDELENHIIAALCGGVAEQIALGQTILTSYHEILDYFAQPHFAGDIAIARQYAQNIIAQTASYIPTKDIAAKIDTIIASMYKKAYQFLLQHKLQIKRIADQLMKKTNLYTDEPYDIIYAARPI